MNKNRIDFISGITCKDDSDLQLALKFFDQTMGMYNIVGECNTDSIDAVGSDRGVSFNIKLHSDKDLEHLTHIVNANSPDGLIWAYGKAFATRYDILDNTSVQIHMVPQL